MTQYRRACVLGLGTSGESAARLLLAEGSQVTVIDSGTSDGLRSKAAALRALGIDVYLDCQQLPAGAWDICVVSPGVPILSPLISSMQDAGVPVIGELELGWSRCIGPVLAITGSNGKSTVVKWCAEALQAAGVSARIAGNYGPPLCAEVMKSPEAGCWVIEVSSFQLETIRHFRADVAVLLNLRPNHLDRHGSMAGYLQQKARIFENAPQSDRCVIPTDLRDEVSRMYASDRSWITFGNTSDAAYYYQDHTICSRERCRTDISGTLFDNPVMGPSAAAVFAALDGLHIPVEHVLHALQHLQPLPHRMQVVGTDNRGIRYIDDSKATNLAAMQAAIGMIEGEIRLIAGGLPKEKDFSSVKEILAERVRSVYLIGQAAEDMFAAWHDDVLCIRKKTLEEAVKAASKDANTGETIVLSPGCASFDQFRSYVERGTCFKGIVQQIMAREVNNIEMDLEIVR